ncbi:Peptidase M14, carboxypeptidase A [Candidatus Magnetomorum sp. HK-1]|nr:Peptidase M14, carboxypeptidase A [Candidatus Magnetomorum sp. HK-1]
MVSAELTSEYKRVRLSNVNHQDILSLTQKGIDIDHVWDDNAIIYIRSNSLSILDTMNISYTVLRKPDVRNKEGYHSYTEIGETLTSIATSYPNICKLYTIGKSYEGRNLWFMKISDNVEIEEDEPEVKYISTMHGDEPVGTELCLNFIHYLVNNYESDPRVTDLVNEMEIWVMPLMNPDGYVHQQRYNMQGIDLNRGFPDRVKDNINTTEGRAIEIQHLMNWAFKHSSVLSANFHTGATVVNYPYDSDFDYYKDYSATPDEELMKTIALSYASLNKSMNESSYFPSGITNGVEWYTAYGGMQDWNYIWLGCNEMTIELNDVKWPSFSEIPSLWNENREAMLTYISWALRGIRGVVTDAETGMPINAIVRVLGIDHDIYTDPDVGDYHRLLLPGVYSVSISADGYLTKIMTDITVDEGHATRHDIQLFPQSFTDIRNAIIILKLISNFQINEPIQKLDITNDGKIGIPDLIDFMRLIAFDPHS